MSGQSVHQQNKFEEADQQTIYIKGEIYYDKLKFIIQISRQFCPDIL